MKIWLAILVMIVGLAAWAGFGGLVWQLSIARTDYVAALERSKQETLRGEGAARLRSTVESTEGDRAALESLVNSSVLRAVEVIEQTAKAAGASQVVMGEATPTGAPEGLSAVSFVVNAEGTFPVLMRTITLFETLPIPASLDQFELENKGEGKGWRLTARVRVFMTSTTP